MGPLGHRPPREGLRADTRRSQTAPGGRRRMAPRGGHRRPVLQNLRGPVVSRVRAFLRRVYALLHPRHIDRDLDEEIAAHLAEAEEEYVQQGLSPPHARLAALRDFGGVTHTRERHRDVRSFVWLENAWRDLRYGSRLLLRNPGFTAGGVCSFGVGVGGETPLFRVLGAVVVRKVPGPRAREIGPVRPPPSFPALCAVSERAQNL